MDWPAFYRPLADGRFESTGATAGPWGAGFQHGGPPSGLLARAMEREAAPVPQRLVRLTVEILRPLPVGTMTIRVETVRPGRRVALLEASAEVDGVECLRARGWRIEVPDRPGPVLPGTAFAMPPIPARSELIAWPGAYLGGYMSAVEWRPTAGAMSEQGPADVWARSRLPLVEGEETSEFCKVALLADSGSGVSLSVDLEKVVSINVDLTLSLWRDLVGEWVFMSARTFSEGVGSGLAETAVGDLNGLGGRVLQTMLMTARSGA